jgi:hypothetical protein
MLMVVACRSPSSTTGTASLTTSCTGDQSVAPEAAGTNRVPNVANGALALTTKNGGQTVRVAVGTTITIDLSPIVSTSVPPVLSQAGVLTLLNATLRCDGGLDAILRALAPGDVLLQVPQCPAGSREAPCGSWVVRVIVV